ncbi:hypothetical protein [Devosia sp. 1566]|uniref:hypothetical protein n=1 Tax=Devosia sp. 1566 TaxID=2499144 RepID=UPI000FD7CCA2|nr:hypothetical protein [Devosia sp. 1566]
MTEHLIAETYIGISVGVVAYCVLLWSFFRRAERSDRRRIVLGIVASFLPFLPMVTAFLLPAVLGRSADGPSNIASYINAFYFWVAIFPSAYVIEKTKFWKAWRRKA